MTNSLPTRPSLVFLLGLQGISALVGGTLLVVDSSGTTLGLPLEWVRSSWFGNYRIPGLFLLVVLGVVPLWVATRVHRGRPGSGWEAVVVGLVLLGWLAVQVLVIGYHRDPPLQLVYGILGSLILLLGLLVEFQEFADSFP